MAPDEVTIDTRDVMLHHIVRGSAAVFEGDQRAGLAICVYSLGAAAKLSLAG
jgi:hypothetical protein